MYRLTLKQNAKSYENPVEHEEPWGDAEKGEWLPATVTVGEAFSYVKEPPEEQIIVGVAGEVRVYYDFADCIVVDNELSDTVMGRERQIWDELQRLSGDVDQLKIMTGVGSSMNLLAAISAIAAAGHSLDEILKSLGVSGDDTIADLIARFGSPAVGGATQFWSMH